MNKKIMIFDDDDAILEIIGIVLKEKGFEVLCKNDSTNALQAVKNANPELVLIDLWMPNTSGEEVIKQMKHDEKTNKIPIIILSASRDTKEKAKDLGVEYLNKPFEITDLEEKVKQNIL